MDYLLVCKRTRNDNLSLPTFCGIDYAEGYFYHRKSRVGFEPDRSWFEGDTSGAEKAVCERSEADGQIPPLPPSSEQVSLVPIFYSKNQSHTPPFLLSAKSHELVDIAKNSVVSYAYTDFGATTQSEISAELAKQGIRLGTISSKTGKSGAAKIVCKSQKKKMLNGDKKMAVINPL